MGEPTTDAPEPAEKTVRLRFTRHAVAAGVAYDPDDEGELPESLAAYYLAERSAVPATKKRAQ